MNDALRSLRAPVLLIAATLAFAPLAGATQCSLEQAYAAGCQTPGNLPRNPANLTDDCTVTIRTGEIVPYALCTVGI